MVNEQVHIARALGVGGYALRVLIVITNYSTKFVAAKEQSQGELTIHLQEQRLNNWWWVHTVGSCTFYRTVFSVRCILIPDNKQPCSVVARVENRAFPDASLLLNFYLMTNCW